VDVAERVRLEKVRHGAGAGVRGRRAGWDERLGEGGERDEEHCAEGGHGLGLQSWGRRKKDLQKCNLLKRICEMHCFRMGVGFPCSKKFKKKVLGSC